MWVARLGLRSQISGIIGESVRRTVNAVRLPPNRSRPLALREEHKQGKALGGDRHSPSRPPPTQNAPAHTLPIIRSGPTDEEELPAPNPALRQFWCMAGGCSRRCHMRCCQVAIDVDQSFLDLPCVSERCFDGAAASELQHGRHGLLAS